MGIVINFKKQEMKKSLSQLILFFLFLLPSLLIAQQRLLISTIQEDGFQHGIHFEKEVSSSFFLSEKIKIVTTFPTPFIMLSGYFEKENFNPSLFFRTFSSDKNQWSEWQPLSIFTEGRTVGRTVYVGGEINSATTYLQLKSNHPIDRTFNLRLFAPGFSKKNQTASTRNPSDICACTQPNFEGRTDWCPSGNCPPDATPQPTEPTHIIVHHSAGQTTSSDFAAVVRSYWDFHVNGNGWDDIGYNWLVDGNGVLYEGRGENRQGAHFSCMNKNTTGICFIGNYENAIPTAEGLEMLQNFIAWAACSKEIDVLAADFHSDSNTNLENVSGHRDGNGLPNSCSSTVCPGENLYPLLEILRDQVSILPCYQETVASANELLENESINIFPNPNFGEFQIKWANIEVTDIVIYNSTGQEIKRWDGSDFQNSFFQTSILQKEAKGIYYAKINLKDNRSISRKIIILP